MGEKVIGIHGNTPLRNGASQSVIELLEKCLDEARRGELIAVGHVGVHATFMIHTKTASNGGMRHLLTAGAAYLCHDLCEEE